MQVRECIGKRSPDRTSGGLLFAIGIGAVLWGIIIVGFRALLTMCN
jgi:hypothetical protein